MMFNFYIKLNEVMKVNLLSILLLNFIYRKADFMNITLKRWQMFILVTMILISISVSFIYLLILISQAIIIYYLFYH